LKRSLCAALGAAALASLLSGCESRDQAAPKTGGAAVPSPNRRILRDEKLKDLVGKDGKPVWTPGKAMTPPAGQPAR
jgi:hypothetical protein